MAVEDRASQRKRCHDQWQCCRILPGNSATQPDPATVEKGGLGINDRRSFRASLLGVPDVGDYSAEQIIQSYAKDLLSFSTSPPPEVHGPNP